jgi:putative tryptophan/tyrosine transport system substrate-binding protein
MNRIEEALRQGLVDLGYVEGQNVAIEWRFAAERTDRLHELAAELVALPVDLIVAMGGEVTEAARQITGTVPIVMAHGGDPVAAGLVASLARPGGNITGISSIASQLVGKRLELLKETSPSITRVGVLWNPTNPAKPPEWEEAQRAARALGVRLIALEVRAPDAFESAFESALQEQADALLVLAEVLTITYGPRIAVFALQSRLPSMFEPKSFVEAGGLMCYGWDRLRLTAYAATYVDKLLKGAEPGDLPVEQPTTFELVINLPTAQGLGLTIPPHVLLQATEIIQ